MEKKLLLIAVLAAVAGFTGGFLVANAINRTELSDLRGENERFRAGAAANAANPDSGDLTADEINARIAEADANPGNFQFQKNLGLSLYRYSVMKQDIQLLKRSISLLERAEGLDASDRDIILALGNAYFDIGYLTKDSNSFERSRAAYEKALKNDPENVEIRTDIGLTYFLQEPPEIDEAVGEFRKALDRKPGHEKTLQFIIQAFVKKGDKAEAEKYLGQLKETNPESRSISELESMVAQTGVPQQ